MLAAHTVKQTVNLDAPWWVFVLVIIFGIAAMIAVSALKNRKSWWD